MIYWPGNDGKKRIPSVTAFGGRSGGHVQPFHIALQDVPATFSLQIVSIVVNGLQRVGLMGRMRRSEHIKHSDICRMLPDTLTETLFL